ncbi:MULTISPECIES: hypothetical protein [Amycolatopsis]|uniref:PE domain-containing protein n=1 Tax=Amycolatopsis bullii TaxID=941987 RepID=A0ABQ3KY61_9PSEU|nr:hypothetical protein [Amycolatopsis bullii]GHG43366.1 hypothetical protein GCM10017567_76840 [Amycolatopsis bullii]
MTDPIFSGIGFWATDMPSSGPPPAGGQGFAMSADEMRAMLKKAEDQLSELSTQIREAEILSRAKPPAEEPVSQDAVDGQNGINPAGRSYQIHLRHQLGYYTELTDRMKQALGITQAADQAAADSTKKIKGSLE